MRRPSLIRAACALGLTGCQLLFPQTVEISGPKRADDKASSSSGNSPSGSSMEASSGWSSSGGSSGFSGGSSSAESPSTSMASSSSSGDSSSLPSSSSAGSSSSGGPQGTLRFSVHPPPSGVVSDTFSVSVQLLDANGEVDGTAMEAVAIELMDAPTGVTLQGTRTRASLAGEAQFPGLRMSHGVMGARLRASATGHGTAVSESFDVQSGDVIITEFMLSGTSRYLELHNRTAAPVDLAGYTLHTGRGADELATLVAPTAGSVLSAGAFAQLSFDGGATGFSVNPSAGFAVGDTPSLFLVNDTGHLQDALAIADVAAEGPLVPGVFPSSSEASTQLSAAALTAAANDDSAQWCTSFPAAGSPGAANHGCTVSAAGAAVINEILVDGSAPGTRFVELLGPAGASVGGLQVVALDGAGAGTALITLPSAARLDARGLFVIADDDGNGTTQVAGGMADVIAPLVLDAADGTVMIWAGSTVVDRVGYGAPSAADGQPARTPGATVSLARSGRGTSTGDNLTDLLEDLSPTPGAPNALAPLTFTAISPRSTVASALDTTTVQVSGSGFSSETVVLIGGATALGCAAQPDRITCEAPARASAEHVDVEVLGGEGARRRWPAAFTYTQAVNESDASSEANYCVLHPPQTITVLLGRTTAAISGQVFEPGLTEAAGVSPEVMAELGVGPDGSDPRQSTAWRFHPAEFRAQAGSDDEYATTLTPLQAGTFRFAYRFSFDGGLHWTYCDQDGAGSDANVDFSAAATGTLTVIN